MPPNSLLLRMGFREYFPRSLLVPPQLPFQLFYRDSIQCQTETYMGKYIWGRVRNDAANENVENVFYRV